jgi:hypothetical protein
MNDGCCQEVIQPNEKLKKLKNVLIIICIITIFLPIIKAFLKINSSSSSFIFIINILFLILAIVTGFYLYIVFFIFYTLINTIYSFVFLGTVLQKLIQSNKLDSKGQLIFCIIEFVFYIFSVYVSFESYKEMKAILLEGGMPQNQNNYGDMSNENNYIGNNNNSNNTNNNTGNKTFVPFSGRGVAVGGS